MKMGVATSEFWLSLITGIVGVLTASGVVSSDEADHLTKAVQALVGAAITIASSLGYIITRTQLKQSVVAAVSDASCSANPVSEVHPLAVPSAESGLTGTAADAFHTALTKAGV